MIDRGANFPASSPIEGVSLDDRIRRAAIHGVITYAVLLKLGATRHAIEHRVRTGRLHPVHTGVFAVGDRRLTRDGRWAAAVMAGGKGAALSHWSAAVFWEMARQEGARPHISVPGRAGRDPEARKKIVVHRPRSLPSAATMTRRQILVTTPQRTLVDLAGDTTDDELLELIGEAARRQLVDLARFHRQLGEVLRAKPKSRLPGRVRSLLRRHAPELHLSESELERRFMTLCTRRGIELPGQQIWIGRARVDFLWSEANLVVEVDGYETHGTLAAMSADYARQRRLTLDGFKVLRFTWSDVVYSPDATAAQIRDALVL